MLLVSAATTHSLQLSHTADLLIPFLNLLGKSGSRINGLAIDTKSVFLVSMASSINFLERIPPTVMTGREIACFIIEAASRL